MLVCNPLKLIRLKKFCLLKNKNDNKEDWVLISLVMAGVEALFRIDGAVHNQFQQSFFHFRLFNFFREEMISDKAD